MHLFFGDGSGGRSGSVLASFEKLDDQARDECDAPDEEIYQPPPPTDEEPPEAAMPPLRHGSCFCFGLCGSSPGFLEELHVYVLTAAFRTSHDATSVNHRAGHPQSRGAMQALYGCRCVLFFCSVHSFFSLCAVIAGGAVLLRSARHLRYPLFTRNRGVTGYKPPVTRYVKIAEAETEILQYYLSFSRFFSCFLT